MDSCFRTSGLPLQVDALKWSNDNRIAYVCDNCINIVYPTIDRMTPSKRVSFERMQISVKPTDETTNKEGKDEDLGLTEKFRTICWSPASCDSLGGCLLAVMTNIGTVKVFGFKGNSSTSEHLEIFSTAPPTQPEHPRVTSVDWSSRCTSDSFIAMGSDSGQIAFYRFSQPPQTIRPQEDSLIESAHNSLVIKLKWYHTWLRDASGRSFTYLCSCSEDGQVKVWKICSSGSGFQVQTEETRELMPADGRAALVLEWRRDITSDSLEELTLAVCKVNGTHIFTLPVDNSRQPLQQFVRFPDCMITAGLQWMPHNHNQFMALTFDGQCVACVNVDGRWQIDSATVKEFKQQFLSVKRDINNDNRDNDNEAESNRVTLPRHLIRFYGLSKSFNGLYTATLYALKSKYEFGYGTGQSEKCYFDIYPSNNGFIREELIASIIKKPQICKCQICQILTCQILVQDYTTDTLLFDLSSRGSQPTTSAIMNRLQLLDRELETSESTGNACKATIYLIENSPAAPQNFKEFARQKLIKLHLNEYLDQLALCQLTKEHVKSLCLICELLLTSSSSEFDTFLHHKATDLLNSILFDSNGELIITNNSQSLSRLLERLTNVSNESQSWENCVICGADVYLNNYEADECQGRVDKKGKLCKHLNPRCSQTLRLISDTCWSEGICIGCGATCQLQATIAVKNCIFCGCLFRFSHE